MGANCARSQLGKLDEPPITQIKIEEPYVGMEFENDDNAYDFYCTYARKVGFRVRKKSMRRCGTGKVIHRRFCCSQDEKRGSIVRCNAQLICKLKDGRFVVVSFIKEHNHDCTESNVVNRNLNSMIAKKGIPKSNIISPSWTNDTLLGDRDQSIEVLSWEPRAFLYHNFLSKEECEYVIGLAKPHMARSLVSDGITGQGTISSSRTSSGTFLRKGQDEIVKNIERRIAKTTFIPVENGERLQVLHYEVGQKFDPHRDYHTRNILNINGGQRIATFLIYLSDVEEGGETIFPSAKGNISSVPWSDGTSQSFKSGLVVKPRIGDALFFWNVKPDNTVDPSSLHGACPVIKGDKWSCTKWIHLKEFKG